jgi:hypothetical protein
MLGQKGFATLIVIQALSKLSYGFRNNSGSLEKLAANRRSVVANTHTLKRLSDMIDSVPVHGERQMARAIVAIMAPVLFIMFTEAGRAADLMESYTFQQSDGSEYTTTFVIKEKGSGLGSTVTGSVNWGHKQNNQDSPDGKLENADWVVEKAERKDLGESEPDTQIVWTIIGKRKDGRSSSRGNDRHQLSHKAWRG